MSEWADRVQNDAVWNQLQGLGTALDEALTRDDASASDISGIERLRSVLTFAGKRLASIEPELVPPGPMDAIAGSAQSATGSITSFQSTGDSTHVAQANSHGDSILAQLANIPHPLVADEWIAIRDASTDYRRTLEKNIENVQSGLRGVNDLAATIESHLQEISAAVDSEKQRIDALNTTFQTTFTSAEASRNQEIASKVDAAIAQLTADVAAIQQRQAELAVDIAAERTKLIALSGEFQSQFSAAQEARSRESADAHTARQDKFAGLIADYTQKLAEQNAEFSKKNDAAQVAFSQGMSALQSNYEDQASSVLDEIGVHKGSVEKLVGVIGNLGVTSGYQKVANYARRSTIVWQAIAVLSMLIVIVFAFMVFLPLLQGDEQETAFNWNRFASRLVIMIPLGVLAAYAAAQADRYLDLERRNRRLALELEAIGPYLAPLPAEKQEAFRLQLGERTFGQDDLALARKKAKSPATSLDVTNQLRELAREVVQETLKAAKP